MSVPSPNGFGRAGSSSPVSRPDGERGDLPKVVLFDLDDTLFDHALTCRAALGRLRVPGSPFRRLPLDRLWHEYSRLLESIQPEVLAGRITIEQARRERFVRLARDVGTTLRTDEAEEYAQAYRSHYQALRRAVPGARPLLRRLHGRARIGIVTNNAVAEQEEKLRHIGLADAVDALVISEAVGVAKPDPRIFAIALERLGGSPEEAVMVGDSWSNDVRGARGAGIRPVWFNRFGEPRPEPLPVAELRSYRAPNRVEEALAARRGRAPRSRKPH